MSGVGVPYFPTAKEVIGILLATMLVGAILGAMFMETCAEFPYRIKIERVK